jgi:colanic acid biosynthesis glycosyl transferase WcaI
MRDAPAKAASRGGPRVCFVNRFFHPDISATSQMLTDLAAGLAGDFAVTVVTSRQRYDEPQAVLPRRETCRGVEVRRLGTSRLGRARLWRRAIDYLTFYLGAMWWLARNVRPGDTVVLMTDPPLLQLVNTAIVRIKGGIIINWLQDIYPELAEQVNMVPGPAALHRLAAAWRDRALRVARLNVAVGEAMQRYLASRGVVNARVIPNWCDGDAVTPLVQTANPLRQAWGLADKFVVGYSGNFGRAHSFAEILQAMVLLAADAHIHFLFIGAGAGLKPLQAGMAQHGLVNASFRPYQAREVLRQSLGVADLHLVSLKPGMEELVMPSKLYGALAAGRPVAFIGDSDGEIAGHIRANDVGITVGQGGGAELAEQIQALARDPERLRRTGERARALFEREFAKPIAIERWTMVLNDIRGQARCHAR